MSVSKNMLNTHFSSYLRGSMENGYPVHVYQPQTRYSQQQPPPQQHPQSYHYQTMADERRTSMGYSGLPIPNAFPHPYTHSRQDLSQLQNPSPDIISFWETSFRESEEPRSLQNSPLVSSSPQYALPASYSFRPIDHYQSTYQPQPFKTENIGSHVPTPSVLPWKSTVDTSMYEDIPLEDWLNGAAEYDNPSPSSADTSDVSPITPGPQDDIMLPEYYSSYNPAQHARMPPHCFGQEYLASTLAPKDTHGGFPETRTFPNGLPFSHGLPGQYNPVYFPNPLLGSNNIESVTASLQDVERRPVKAVSEEHYDDEEYHDSSSRASPSTSQSEEPQDEEGDDDDDDDEEPDAREQSNSYLLAMRNQGHSYKTIKRLGHFSQAESTLRGRVRTLTKDKSQRVRQPVWKGQDERLLRLAVRHFARDAVRGRRGSRTKLPWKKIGEWMWQKGSSYEFAPATCAKKWEKIK